MSGDKERIHELEKCLAEKVLLKTGDIISLESGRVGGTDIETVVQKITRQIRQDVEQILMKGK